MNLDPNANPHTITYDLLKKKDEQHNQGKKKRKYWSVEWGFKEEFDCGRNEDTWRNVV